MTVLASATCSVSLQMERELTSKRQFEELMRGRKMVVSGLAQEILPHVEFLPGEVKSTELGIMSGYELGFTKRATRIEVNQAIRKFGELCPPDFGPRLRLQLTDQVFGESLVMAMRPLLDSQEKPRVFTITHLEEDMLRLSCRKMTPEDLWDADTNWVFVRRPGCVEG